MPSAPLSADAEMPVRLAAFQRLEELTRLHGPVLDWKLVEKGFSFRGEHYRFATKAKGIFRPRQMHGSALSIKTIVPRGNREVPYDDSAEDPHSGIFTYRFQGKDPLKALRNPANRLLELAYRQQIPLIYFRSTEPGRYRPLWPVFIAHFNPQELKCRVVKLGSDDLTWMAASGPVLHDAEAEAGADLIRRRYVAVQAKKRLHQALFRARVLDAYGRRCAVCLLPYETLLHAAHIRPDSDELGEATVQNGLALCLLHHGAFDTDLMGIHPDGHIELSPKLADTSSLPMSQHAFHAFAGRRIHIPARPEHQPSPVFLEERYRQFLQQAP